MLTVHAKHVTAVENKIQKFLALSRQINFNFQLENAVQCCYEVKLIGQRVQRTTERNKQRETGYKLLCPKHNRRKFQLHVNMKQIITTLLGSKQ